MTAGTDILRSSLVLLGVCLAAPQAQGETNMPMILSSTAFQDAGAIPAQYTCDGADTSPALAWTGEPERTQSFVLICDDPDAPMGTWVHWVIYDIPADVHGLAASVPPNPELPSGARQGVNDFKKTGYGGPCPPGGTHRYFFRLYALDTLLKLPPNKTRQEVLTALQGHILTEATLMGTYAR